MKTIILVIIGIIVISLLGYKISDIISNPTVQTNFSYVWNWLKHIWDTYLSNPAKYLWNDVFIKLIWEQFIDTLQRIKDKVRPEILEQENLPQVPMNR